LTGVKFGAVVLVVGYRWVAAFLENDVLVDVMNATNPAIGAVPHVRELRVFP
jgi:hypothetical protein